MTSNAAAETVHAYKAGRLTGSVVPIRRRWRHSERRPVLQALTGRACAAAQPVLCGVTFLALTIGMLLLGTDPAHPDDHRFTALSPLFALGAAACAVYATALLWPPVRALAETFRPIFIVDGYVRYRPPDAASPADSNGYVAVLGENRAVACEWAVVGERPLRSATVPAWCEFSEYRGIHRIDGRPTVTLPHHASSMKILRAIR